MSMIDLTKLREFSTQLWNRVKNNFYPHTTNRINDANLFVEPGVALTNRSTTNLPTGLNATGIIQCFKESNAVCIQLWYGFSNNNVIVYIRNKWSNSWNEWKKISDSKEIADTVINARYDSATDSIVLEKKDGSTININTSHYANISKDNVFGGTNAFTGDVLIANNNIFSNSIFGALYDTGFTADRFSGSRNVTSHSNNNNGYVEYVRVKVVDSKNVGDKITGVHLVAVEKKATKTEDVIIEHLTTNKTFLVERNSEYGNHINIPVRKQFNTETYFAIGNSSRERVFKQTQYALSHIPNVVFTTVAEMPQAGGTMPDSNMAWVIQYGLVGKDTNVRDFINSTPRQDWSNLNHVTRNDSNKIVIDGAEVKTSFDNTGTGLQANTVDSAIKELKNLVGSGSNGISRTEFEQHVSNNEQQHQTINSNISSNTRKIDTANYKITGLENNAAMKESENIFTSKNVFTNRSPIVDKYFSIKNIAADGINELYTGGTYCCNPREGITTNSHISAIVLPIYNSRPGDTVEASYFMFNASSFRTTSNVSTLSTYTVQDIQYQGHYCIVININNTFNYPVGFGFRVQERYAESRRIGLLKQSLPNQSSNNAWSSYHEPSNGTSLGLTDKFMIPYTITKKAQSEVVTRFDLSNNTIPINVHKIGEFKTLAYDAGEQFELGGNTWLRCDGQSLSIQTYNELHKHIRNVSKENLSTFRLLNKPDYGYLYICIK